MKEVAFKWAFKKDMGFGRKEIPGNGNNVTKGKRRKARIMNSAEVRVFRKEVGKQNGQVVQDQKQSLGALYLVLNLSKRLTLFRSNLAVLVHSYLLLCDKTPQI